MKLIATIALCALAFLALQITSRAAPISRPPNIFPPEVTLQSLHRVANVITTDSHLLAYNTYVFVRQFLNKDPPTYLPSCFNIERDNSTNYLTKLAVDYQTAAGYSWYFKTMVAFYNESLQKTPESPFNYYFNGLNTKAAELQQSIANIVHIQDSNMELTTPNPPTAPSLGKKDEVDCTNVCLDSVARVTRKFLVFIMDYVQPDLAGVPLSK